MPSKNIEYRFTVRQGADTIVPTSRWEALAPYDMDLRKPDSSGYVTVSKRIPLDNRPIEQQTALLVEWRVPTHECPHTWVTRPFDAFSSPNGPAILAFCLKCGAEQTHVFDVTDLSPKDDRPSPMVCAFCSEAIRIDEWPFVLSEPGDPGQEDRYFCSKECLMWMTLVVARTGIMEADRP